MLFYKPSLERLGMTVTVRTVDEAQFINRERNRDFDIITNVWGQSLSPGNEQRGYWGSQAADQLGSRNLVGIKNPAIDALIERVIFAKDRAELVAATKALDRVLLWNHYVVPQWTYGKQRTARWDRFGRPEKLPEYGAVGVPDHLVVGRRARRQDRIALVTVTRREALDHSVPARLRGWRAGSRRAALPPTRSKRTASRRSAI